jgi:hypothetical protein
MLAMTGSSWVEVVLVGSIVVPVSIAAWVVVFLFRRSRDDPDQARMKQAQEEYAARQGRRERPRR